MLKWEVKIKRQNIFYCNIHFDPEHFVCCLYLSLCEHSDDMVDVMRR